MNNIENKWMSVIDKCWHDINGNLKYDFNNMAMNAMKNLINTDYLIPFQRISFYVINNRGYIKIRTLNLPHIMNLSINRLVDCVCEYCKNNDYTFIAFASGNLTFDKLEHMLGNRYLFEIDATGLNIY
jgi:hypothetical protein